MENLIIKKSMTFWKEEYITQIQKVTSEMKPDLLEYSSRRVTTLSKTTYGSLNKLLVQLKKFDIYLINLKNVRIEKI